MPRPLTTVVLVEGPFDALRLCWLGIPALSILGTQNWTAQKISILNSRRVSRAIICMDGDPAGRVAENAVFGDLEGLIKRSRFRLPIEDPSIDPGNMSMALVDALREFGHFATVSQ